MITAPEIKEKQSFEEARQFIRGRLQALAHDEADRHEPGAQVRAHRIEVPIVTCNGLSWLAQQRGTVRAFWRERSGESSTAGIGLAWEESAEEWGEGGDIWNALSVVLKSDENLRVFAGMSFHKSLSGLEWQTFKSIRFFVPRFEMINDVYGTRFVCNVVLGQGKRLPLRDILKELEALSMAETVSRVCFQILERFNQPGFEQWSANVCEALAAIETGGIDKVVLARRVTVTLDRMMDPCVLLERLLRDEPRGYAFLFQFDDGHAFLGLTPEQFYARTLDSVCSEAVAGTRVRGADAYEDALLRQELVDSVKEKQEHRFVLASIVTAFREVCQSYAVDGESEVLRLSRQQHLLSRISGKLTAGVTDRELCAALHPTPAVGGVPLEEAIRFINRAEDFDRGWFAGPVGYFRCDSAELAVAIRSALIEGDKLHLYSGAGIVQGSEPLAEWEEAELKIAQYLDILYGR